MFAAAGLLNVPLLARWDTGQSIRLYELKMIHLLTDSYFTLNWLQTLVSRKIQNCYGQGQPEVQLFPYTSDTLPKGNTIYNRY